MEFNKCKVCGDTYKDTDFCPFCGESVYLSEKISEYPNLNFENFISVVIVGGGFSGFECALRIRNINKFCKITIITKSSVFYNKTKMLKSEKITNLNEFDILSSEQLNELNIEIVSGYAQEINRLEKMVKLDDGTFVCFDKLILATGYKYNPQETSTIDIIPFNSKNDIEKILRYSVYNDTAIIYGSDIWCYYAYNLLKDTVKNLYVISPENLIAETYLGYVLSKDITNHINNIHTNVEITSIASDNVTLSNGNIIKTSLIIDTSKGIPSITLAENSSVECDKKIIVTEYMETNDPNIFALGGCTDEENIINIRRQAQVIAYKLFGKNKKYSPVSSVKTISFNNDSYCFYGDLSDLGDIYCHASFNKSKNIYLKDGTFKGFCFKNTLKGVDIAITKTDTLISKENIIEILD